jgi:hypothetical protein
VQVSEVEYGKAAKALWQVAIGQTDATQNGLQSILLTALTQTRQPQPDA